MKLQIIPFLVIDSKDNNQSMDKSDIWDDLNTEYTVESERDCRIFLRLLEEANVAKLKIHAWFEEEYQLQEFQREWKLQTSEMEEETEERKKRGGRYLLKRPEGYPQDEIMKLGRDMYRGEIFMQAFQEDLKRIQIEYNYKLFCDSNSLRIFMPENHSLNAICKNKLMELKNSLSVFYTQDSSIITMLRSSKKLRDLLLTMGIVTWLKSMRGNLWVMFYSTIMKDFQIREKVQEVVRFDIAVISIYHKSLKLTELECIFYLMKTSLAPGMQSIKQMFQMDIQFNDQYQSIVIHHQHASFSMEPEAYVKQLLDSLVILSVKSGNIKEFDNKVKKSIKQLPFLFSKMNASRNQTFLCINVDQLNEAPEKIREKYIQTVVKLFLEVVEKDLEIKVYFAHLHKYDNAMRQVLQLAENSYLTIANFDKFYDCSQLKGVFRLKDYSEIISLKRQKEVGKFIQGLITKNFNQLNDSITDKIFKNEDGSMLQSSDCSSFHLQNLSIVQQSKNKCPWLIIPFKMPKFKDYGDEQRAYVKDKRERELQKLFNQQGGYKFKIWRLQLSAHIKQPTQVIEKDPLIIKKPFFGKDLNRNMEICSLQDFKVHEQGAIVFQTRDLKTDFLPICLFERIE